MKKIGLLGGSFDPVHTAHLALARAALQTLALDEVQFIPAGQPWQRGALCANRTQRCEMIRLAIAAEPGLTLNTIEVDRPGPTYTVETLRALPRGPQYIWLLGSDQLANFCSWHDWAGIVALADLAVATRPGTPLAAPAPLQQVLARAGRTLLELPLPPMAVSASEIRRRLAQGLPVGDLLPKPVLAYIEACGLYRP